MLDQSSRETRKLLESAKDIGEVNYFQELLKPAKDRLKQPINFSFIWSFAIFNWDLILYLLFSNATIEARIDRIYLRHNDFTKLFLYPALTSLLYIIVSPYVQNLIKVAVSYAKSHDYKIQEKALNPVHEFRIAEANKAKELQIIISDSTDIALLNEKVENLEKQSTAKDIQFQQQKETLDNTLKELRESNTLISSMKLELATQQRQFDEEKSELQSESRNLGNSINKHLISAFDHLYDKSKFREDLFQDKFVIEKQIRRNEISRFINLMKDRMKYFGIFTSEIFTDDLGGGKVRFTIHFNYPNLIPNPNTVRSLTEAFESVK